MRSTPTIFVNGVKHKGAQNVDYYTTVIDGELGKLTDAADKEPRVGEE
ncbi:hypothetical protein GN156_28640 [bacterium LRH843]|nr:hypothetical protein [bacterium LRH843]